MFKKMLAAVMAGIMLMSSSAAAVAAQPLDGEVWMQPAAIVEDELMPLYSYTQSAAASLDISNGVATCLATLKGYSGTTTKIEVTMTLQKKTALWWPDVISWSTTYNNYYMNLSRSESVSSGTYRVKAEFKVYNGSKSETVTVYSGEDKC